MMTCDAARDTAVRSLEGDLDAREALAFGRHLQSCTACKIRLHREHRLREMLERDLSDPIAVGEGFTRNVMKRLPAEPPSRRRRILRLASWTLPVAGAALGGASFSPGFRSAWGATWDAFGRSLLGESGVEILLGGIAAAGRAVVSAGFGGVSVRAADAPVAPTVWFTLAGFGAAAAASALCAWAAWRTARSTGN